VRRYAAPRHTYALVHGAVYFASGMIGAKARLTILFKKFCAVRSGSARRPGSGRAQGFRAAGSSPL